MAGTLKTDLAAVTFSGADIAAAPLGVDLPQFQQAILSGVDDTRRRLAQLNAMLPSGTAKTAVGVAITDAS